LRDARAPELLESRRQPVDIFGLTFNDLLQLVDPAPRSLRGYPRRNRQDDPEAHDEQADQQHVH
jgi:hypothetical protein